MPLIDRFNARYQALRPILIEELSAPIIDRVDNTLPLFIQQLHRAVRTELFTQPFPAGAVCPFCGFESTKPGNNIRNAQYDCSACRYCLFVFILMQQEDGRVDAINWVAAIDGVFRTFGWGGGNIFRRSFCVYCGFGPKRYDSIGFHSATCRIRSARVQLGRTHALRFLLLRGANRF